MFLGIDTYERYSQVAVVDDDGKLHDEIHLPNDRFDELAEHLDVTLVNPSTLYGRPIADNISAEVYVEGKQTDTVAFQGGKPREYNVSLR